MLRKKISILCMCASLLACNLPLTSTVFASSANLSTISTQVQDVSLTKTDEANINKSINKVLSLQNDVLQTGKATDYSNIIKEPKLLELGVAPSHTVYIVTLNKVNVIINIYFCRKSSFFSESTGSYLYVFI